MAVNTVSHVSSLDEDLWDFTEIPLRSNVGDNNLNIVIIAPSDTGEDNLNDLMNDEVGRVSSCHVDNGNLRPTTVANEDHQRSAYDLVGPSCIAGAVVGLLLGGPILAAVVGLGSAHAARKEGRAGDVARAMGETVLYIQSTGQAWEDQHHILQDMQPSITCDGGSQVIGRVFDVMQKGWKSAGQLNQRHKWTERGMEFTSHRLKDFSGKIHSMSDKRQKS